MEGINITIDKNKLVNISAADKKLPCHQRKLHKRISKTDDFIVNQLNITHQNTIDIIKEQNSKETIDYILWNDFWNKYGIYGDLRENKKNTTTFLRYSIGSKIFVDLGFGNIGKELSMPHPAIVLFNFAETVVIVPTTSDDGNSFSEEMEMAIIKCSSDKFANVKYPIFPENTVINLHQIRTVHKNRIIKNLNCNVSNYIMKNHDVEWLNRKIKYNAIPYGINLRECIRLKIMHLFTRENFFDYIRIKKQNEVYNKKIKEYLEIIKFAKSNANDNIDELINDMNSLLTD